MNGKKVGINYNNTGENQAFWLALGILPEFFQEPLQTYFQTVFKSVFIFFHFQTLSIFAQLLDVSSDCGNKKLNSWSLHQGSDDKDRKRGHSSSLYPYHYVQSRNRENCTSFKLDDLVFLKFEISLIKVRWFISQTLFIKHYFYQLKIYQTKIPNSHILYSKIQAKSVLK